MRNYSYDGLDRLTKVSDLEADGTTLAAASYDYDLLGRMIKATNPNTHATSYSYDKVGHFTKDSDSKLLDFHARTYDPSVGRFTSKDPVAGKLTMPQTLDPYPFSMNNPLTYPDPYGLFAASTGGARRSGHPVGDLVDTHSSIPTTFALVTSACRTSRYAAGGREEWGRRLQWTLRAPGM